jgi:tetratricopeptide (TPR) repeat protein
MESRIAAEQPKSENNPEYWRERAQYYHGRQETAQEEAALKQGLALTVPAIAPERRTKGYADARRWMLGDYARFLGRHQRHTEAVALLRQELTDAPADSESAIGAAHLLAFDFKTHVTPDDELLWTWLAQRAKWEFTEERVLREMIEKAKPESRDGHFKRAETMTADADPSRAAILGWILNRLNQPARSIPLLVRAMEQAPADSELRKSAAFSLFESYLDVNDWKSAETLFPAARQRLSATEVSEWYAKIAVAAARAGAKDDALRLWKAVVNLNPAELSCLRDLVKAGLRDALTAFYRDLQKQMPDSEWPTRALQTLESSK